MCKILEEYIAIMAMTVDMNRLTVDKNYAQEVLENQGKKYNINQAVLDTMEETYGARQMAQWKADFAEVAKDKNSYDVEVEDTSLPEEETTPTKETNKTAPSEEETVDNKSKINRKVDNNSKRGKATKWLSLGAGIGALGCGAYVGLTMGAGAGAVTVGSLGVALAAITAFTVGLAYLMNKPNKDVHEELQTLKKSMLDNDVELANSLIKLQESQGKVEVIKEEIEETQEKTNEEIEAKQKELEEKQARIDELNAKSETEEGLTDEEKAELETLGAEVQVLSDEITALSEEGADDVDGQEEKLNEEQNTQEESADVFKSAKDIADYAATFDEEARDATKEEQTAQQINAALGLGTAAAITFAPILNLTPAGHVARAMALFGGTVSLAGAKEQGDFVDDMSEEIGVRKGIQAQATEDIKKSDEAQNDVDNTVAKAEQTQETLEAAKENAEAATQEVENGSEANAAEEAGETEQPAAAEGGEEVPENTEEPEKKPEE